MKYCRFILESTIGTNHLDVLQKILPQKSPAYNTCRNLFLRKLSLQGYWKWTPSENSEIFENLASAISQNT